MAELRIPELVEWRVREVFRDARLGEGEYALLLGATFQAPDRTLREEELQAFRRRWWRLLARRARGCEREQKLIERGDSALYSNAKRACLGGGGSDG